MASCDSFRQIFDTPLSDTQSSLIPSSLIDSLSPWNQIKSPQPIELSSFTEIFGELHFKETSESVSSLPFPPLSSSLNNLGNEKLNRRDGDDGGKSEKQVYMACSAGSDGFLCNNSESLQLCTEGLGVESFDDMGEVKQGDDQKKQEKGKHVMHSSYANLQEYRRLKSFPPPISTIGRNGKPWVCYKAYRQDGRFILKEMRVPTQEFIHACREDGRLTMHLVQPNEEIQEDEEEGENIVECEEQEEEAVLDDGDDTDGHRNEEKEPDVEMDIDENERNS